MRFDDKTKNISAKCNKCSEIIKGNTTSTGNFRLHVKKDHPALNAELNKIEQSKYPERNFKQCELRFKNDSRVNILLFRSFLCFQLKLFLIGKLITGTCSIKFYCFAKSAVGHRNKSIFREFIKSNQPKYSCANEKRNRQFTDSTRSDNS